MSDGALLGTAVGWAVSVTSFVVGLVLSGKLRLERETLTAERERDDLKAALAARDAKLDESAAIIRQQADSQLKLIEAQDRIIATLQGARGDPGKGAP